VNVAQRDKARTYSEVEGYITENSVVPMGKRIYCLGRVTLDKQSKKLTFGREPTRPFILQYGTEEELIDSFESTQAFMKYGSYFFAATGGACLVGGMLQLAQSKDDD